MGYPDSHLELLTAEQAKAFQANRSEMTRQASVSTTEALDSQLTWWMIKEVFDRHPHLGAFETHGEDITGQDDKRNTLLGLRVDVFAVGEDGRQGGTPEALREAHKEIMDVLAGYGLANLWGLVDLIDTEGCDREGLDHWDWGQFGKGWAQRRREASMNTQLPASTTPLKPSSRF